MSSYRQSVQCVCSVSLVCVRCVWNCLVLDVREGLDVTLYHVHLLQFLQVSLLLSNVSLRHSDHVSLLSGQDSVLRQLISKQCGNRVLCSSTEG